MSISRRTLLSALLAAASLLAGTGCALLKPASSSAPAVTAGRTNQPPSGLSARLRENFGVRPTPQPATAASASTPAPVTATVAAPATNTGTVAAPYKMRISDNIVIMLRDLPDTRYNSPIEDVIDDNGMVNLPLIGRMTAAGKTTSVFEQEIEKKYVDEGYFRRLTVNVVIPQRFIFVTGEVRQSNKYPLVSGMTLSQAIATAGGPTEFADRKKIKLIRAGKTTLYSLVEIQKDPTKDVQLEAGDQVEVSRDWY